MILDIDPELYDLVRRVLPGKYNDVNQFVDIAVRNQLALEDQSLTPTQRLEAVTARALPTPAAASGARLEDSMRAKPGSADAAPEAAPDAGVSEATDTEWRELLSRHVVPVDGLPEPSVLDEPEAVLWGQTNRVLPIAVGVRVLAHLVDAYPGGVSRDDWYASSVRAAQGLRRELEAWDRAAGRKRGELWATALPKQDPASESRYVGQFLGHVRRDGRAEGGAAFLDLVVFGGTDESATVTLTTGGAKFSSFENPIFDQDSPATTFSREEVEWFLGHVRQYRPSEYKLLAETAELVDEGRTRTEIDKALSEAHPTWSHYIETMRAGALGRLSDLGLLSRTRRGLEVDYHMTDLARELDLLDSAVLK